MYWQVYLHKTVLCAEQMLKRIIKRAKYIGADTSSAILQKILHENPQTISAEEFCKLDDYDVLYAIKEWCNHPDTILSFLCRGIINRDLLKVKYFGEPVSQQLIDEKHAEAKNKMNLTDEETEWIVFTGEAISNTYNFENEHIHILFKNGTVKDISEVDNALINQKLNSKIKKYYICYTRI